MPSPQAPASKPHSAPARGLQLQAKSHKLKFLRTRSNAVKEIEEWAKDGRSAVQQDVAIGRNAGTQLSDNVTEERMLQARLMELSKERHKFINQITYEKKMFLDRQQRKSAALRERLKNVSLDQSRFKSKSATVSSASRGGVSSRRRRRSMKRNILQVRVDRAEEREEEHVRPQTVPPRLEELTPIPDLPPQTPPIFQTEPLIPETKYSGPGEGGLPRLTTPVRTVKFPEDEQGRDVPGGTGGSFRRANTWVSQQKATPITQPKQDLRYKQLERSLCENYVLPPGAKLEQVSDIVGRIEALSVKAKVQREAKPKLALKAYQFLAQSRRGVTVNT